MWEGLPFHPPHHRKLRNPWGWSNRVQASLGYVRQCFKNQNQRSTRRVLQWFTFFSPPFLFPPLPSSISPSHFPLLSLPASSSVTKAGFELLVIPLPLHIEFWDHNYIPSCPAATCLIATCSSPEFWQGCGISCLLRFDFFCLSCWSRDHVPLASCPPLSLSPPPCVLPVLSRCQVFNLLACLSFIDLFLTHRCLPAPEWLSVPEPRQRWNILAAACLDGCQLITSPGDRGCSCFPSSRMEHGGAE